MEEDDMVKSRVGNTLVQRRTDGPHAPHVNPGNLFTPFSIRIRFVVLRNLLIYFIILLTRLLVYLEPHNIITLYL